MRLLCAFLTAGLMLFAAEPGRNARVNQEDRIIPHLGVGGSWTTEITLVNVWGAPATVDLRFFDGNGMPLNVLADGYGNTSLVRVNLQVGGSQRVVLKGGNTTLMGWARVDYDWAISEVAVSAVFRQSVAGRPDFEALSPASSGEYQLRVQFDETNGYTTGFALVNPETVGTTLEFIVRRENGDEINVEPVTITLPSQGHTAFTFRDHPQLGPLTRDRKGVIDVRTQSGRDVAALGLRFSPSNSFTTVLPYGFSD